MKQLTFLQEGSNRILSKAHKSFWSCTHVNSCQNYTLSINLLILLNILSKATSNIHQVHEKITRIDQKDKKIHCVLLSHELLSTKIYYTSIYIFYFKNDGNPTCTSEDTCKTIIIIFLIVF